MTDEVERHCCNLPCRRATVLFVRRAKRKSTVFYGCSTADITSVAYRRQLPLWGKLYRCEPPAGESPEREAIGRQSLYYKPAFRVIFGHEIYRKQSNRATLFGSPGCFFVWPPQKRHTAAYFAIDRGRAKRCSRPLRIFREMRGFFQGHRGHRAEFVFRYIPAHSTHHLR